MYGTRRKKKQLADYSSKSWCLEILQIYHMPIMNIKQGWYLMDIFPTEEAALKKLVEYKQGPCELRVRELTDMEEEVLEELG